MSTLIRAGACILVVALALGGCTVGPDYVAPEPDVPDQWSLAVTEGLTEGTSNVHRWWEAFEDPVLQTLIEHARDESLQLDLAFARIREARALRGVAKGEWFPDLEGAGSVERGRTSEDFIGGGVTDTVSGVGLDATWEIDVWGRIARAVEASDASLQATVEDYRDVLVLLYAEVGLNYLEARALQARIRFAEENIEAQRGTADLTRTRRDAGVSPDLDVSQAELNLARTESLLPTLREAYALTVHRLSVLVGEYPGWARSVLAEADEVPMPPAEVAIGLPADLARQRPDIRRAERELAAQSARIGVATADLYPRFSLSGSFAYAGTSDIFDSSKREWSFGPAFRWNLFDGGRVRNQIAAEDARTQQALVLYEQAVLSALEDVESSVVSYHEERLRHQALGRSVASAVRAVDLVKTLYRTGLTDFQNVLDMERSLADQQDALAESSGRMAQNLVGLYRALGGGWDPDPERLRAEQESMVDGEPVI